MDIDKIKIAFNCIIVKDEEDQNNESDLHKSRVIRSYNSPYFKEGQIVYRNGYLAMIDSKTFIVSASSILIWE